MEALTAAACAAASAQLGTPVNVRVLDASGDLRMLALTAPDPDVARDIRTALEGAAVPMPIVEAFITGEPVVSRRLGSSALIVQELLTRRHISGMVVAPLHVHGRTIGVMAAARFNGSEASEDEVLRVLVGAAFDLSRTIEARDLFDLSVQELGRRALIERRHEALLQHGSDAVFVISRTGRIIDVTPSVTPMLGFTPDFLVGRHINNVVDPAELEDQLLNMDDRVGTARAVELHVSHVDGTPRVVECTAVDLLEDPAIGGYVVTARDVTDRHRANELLAAENEILARIAARESLEEILDAVARVLETSMDVMTPLILALDEAGRVSVLAASGLPRPFVRSMEGHALTTEAMEQIATAEGGLIIANVDRDPQWQPEWRDAGRRAGIRQSWSHQLRDPSGRVLGIVCVFLRDEREPSPYERHVLELASRLAGMALAQDRSSREMAHAATHDPLTGLPNRTMFLTRLEHMLRRWDEANLVAVVFIDLDDFKLVNDTAGHAVGDRLLLAVAERLASAVRPMDLIARLGGDEFAILCEGLDADGASAVAERVLEVFQMPLIVDDQLFDVSGSAGIAVGGRGSTPDTMLRDADTAMYEAKRMGRARYAVFTPAVRDAAVRRTTLAQELRRAIARDDLDVHYQPVIELGSGRIAGLEALARWTSPTHGEVPTQEFIEVAESAGLIASLGAVVLRRAVERAALWRSEGLLDRDAYMAVNVSPYQLADPIFVQTVIDTLARAGFPARCLCLELTESAVLTVEDADEALARLTGLGITIAIDDFGTGHSSLSRLRTLDAKVLKLDRSFVIDLDIDPGSVEVAAGVIHLAHALGKRLIVEGVERVTQLRLLEELGADAVQGFYLSCPKPAEAIEDLLRVTPAWA